VVDVTEPRSGADPVEPSAPDAAAVDAPEVGAGPLARQHPVVVYTLLRLGMLAAVGAVLYLVGLRGVWLLLFAFLVSGVVSAFVLSRPREGAVLGITTAVRSVNARIDATARAEDDDLDDVDEQPAGSADEQSAGSADAAPAGSADAAPTGSGDAPPPSR
jgi:hypothetical protein